MKNLMNKYLFLSIFGGLTYCLIEILWRGYSHWTMLFLGGICFVSLGLLNEIFPWRMPLYQQVISGSLIITVLEFLTGCIVNLFLGWNIWDYSNLPGNILGQVCPQFFVLWMVISLLGIILDDYLRYKFFDEETPHYNIGLSWDSDRIIYLVRRKES